MIEYENDKHALLVYLSFFFFAVTNTKEPCWSAVADFLGDLLRRLSYLHHMEIEYLITSLPREKSAVDDVPCDPDSPG